MHFWDVLYYKIFRTALTGIQIRHTSRLIIINLKVLPGPFSKVRFHYVPFLLSHCRYNSWLQADKGLHRFHFHLKVFQEKIVYPMFFFLLNLLKSGRIAFELECIDWQEHSWNQMVGSGRIFICSCFLSITLSIIYNVFFTPVCIKGFCSFHSIIIGSWACLCY